MKCVSTRQGIAPVSLSTALSAGLAPDGGLYVPAEALPQVVFSNGPHSIASVGKTLLTPLFADDGLAAHLNGICDNAFTFDAPLNQLGDSQTHLLELFHGPTAAFKDFGARFLAECLSRLKQPGESPTTILVATSGDTGAAVASAFHRRPGFSVVILYPDGRVSPRQAHGLGCFGDNISALKVAGTFDDCQALVKRALQHPELAQQLHLSSANSISLGRLLPQMTYFARASLQFHERTGQLLNVCVPTGNLGNALACVLAKKMGLPVGDIVLATNANKVLPDFFAGGAYAPGATMATLANAMDVGAPSNFERLRWLVPEEKLRTELRAFSVSDAEIRQTIASTFQKFQRVICPHTATAVQVVEQLRRQGDTRPWAVASTAHPAKFETVVEPLIGAPVPVPQLLAESLARPASAVSMKPEFEGFVSFLRSQRA